MGDLIIENGDRLIVNAGSIIPGEGSTQAEPAGTRVFEVSDVGDVLMGPNTLSDPEHWHTGSSAAAVDDFRFDAATRGITARGLGLTQVRDPVDLVIARIEGGLDEQGEDDRTKFTGVLDETNLGAIYWRGGVTPTGGSPGSTTGAGWDGRSAQIYARACQHFFPGKVPGRLIFQTTPINSSAREDRLVVTSEGAVGITSAVLAEGTVQDSAERGQLWIGGAGGRCIRFLNGGPELIVAAGTPGSAVAARGSLWLRTDGGAGTTVYAKTGIANNAWTAIG